ncbi:MAG TPA: xanthine dehydrogenase accessory protein XdhC, partial [Acetobacteraceae bacterium]
ARAEGSVPREPGAKMLATGERLFDTIGGGHLEYVAAATAREMLALPAAELAGSRRLQRIPLGPALGQCCGGVAWLAFERVDMGDAACHAHFHALRERLARGASGLRLLSLDDAAPARLADGPVDAQPGCTLIQQAEGGRRLEDLCAPPAARLYLFGAGHVGAALVRALAPLPCRITWVDEREELFPSPLPANVTAEVTDIPEAVVAEAPPGASFLVMTHSHALDQRLAEAILRRDGVGWFGLIGSKTKRLQFERRLRERGLPAARLADMVCPIGIEGIGGKEPAVIAIAVAAQLLQVWQRQAQPDHPDHQ